MTPILCIKKVGPILAGVVLDNVTKVFDKDIKALDKVCLDIEDGDVLTVVGPSGCGKTTLLRSVAGLEAVTSGTISIGQTMVNDVPPKDRDVAMVFQNYALYPHMTVYQNMGFALKLRRFPKHEIKQRVFDAADILNIRELLDRSPQALSGGQRQRVAIGRAIVTKPSVFLFDEPMSQLDPQFRGSMRRELRMLQQKIRTTTIYVTHDQKEAMALGDRVAVMHDGVVQQVGMPSEVYANPINRFVAGFLGDVPMNFIEGMISLSENLPVFTTSEGDIALPKGWADQVLPYHGKALILGIRPHDVHYTLLQKQAEQGMVATVELVEALGDRNLVYATTKCGVKMRVSQELHTQVKVGDQVIMHLDGHHAHLFQKGPFGQNVIQQSEPSDLAC